MPREAVTINKAAEYWGVSRRTIYRWIETEKVDVVLAPSGRQRVVLQDRASMGVARALAPTKARRKG